jgi:hypothetical protein
MSLIAELKRRNVFRVAVAYTVIAWVLAQVADLALDNFGAPDWVPKTVLFLLALGFPLAIFFAWSPAAQAPRPGMARRYRSHMAWIFRQMT